MQARHPPRLWNSEQTSSEVQNRHNLAAQKKDLCPPNFFSKKLLNTSDFASSFNPILPTSYLKMKKWISQDLNPDLLLPPKMKNWTSHGEFGYWVWECGMKTTLYTGRLSSGPRGRPRISQRGRQTLRGLQPAIWPIFPKSAWKWRNFDPGGESLVNTLKYLRLIGSALGTTYFEFGQNVSVLQ